MTNLTRVAVAACFVITSSVAQTPLRPPAVPLICHDPYFSIWSAADRLTDAWPVHWTGHPHAMQCLLRIERAGETASVFRLIGPKPAEVPPLPQLGLEVRPTTTVYRFGNEDVHVTLSFCSPALPSDLDLYSRPASYVTWDVAIPRGAPADVTIRFDLVGEVAVDDPGQDVTWSVDATPMTKLLLARIGSREQAVLEKVGDDRRIDWGWAFVATAPGDGRSIEVLPADETRAAFAAGKASPTFEAMGPRRASDRWPAITATLPLRSVRADARSTFVVVAYDDEWSLRYFDARLRPYWRRGGADAPAMLAAAVADREKVLAAASAFDRDLVAELTRIGGSQYAALASLAYRQAVAGNKLVADANGKPLLFPKENFSNGCIGTVDVIYPMAPLFLAQSPDLARAMLIPVLDYGASSRWKFPFAPHDLGTYPHATGQVYGGGEKTAENQMPVEESANLILLVAAASRADGSKDLIAKYASTLARWADYLRQKGYDPENQLCTDDFTGHLAHNVNLSAKAILALGAYAWILDRRGDGAGARAWRESAETFAARWVKEADDGEKTRLAFDRPGSWSQKYNLVWDDVLSLGLFPAAIKAREVAWYRKVQQPYGLPLDDRADFTKTDWTHWSALLSGDRSDFEALIAPLHRLMNETPDRVPLCDWMKTKEPRKINMIARPVVGGYFMPLLRDAAAWKRWSARGSKVAGGAATWAPIPIR